MAALALEFCQWAPRGRDGIDDEASRERAHPVGTLGTGSRDPRRSSDAARAEGVPDHRRRPRLAGARLLAPTVAVDDRARTCRREDYGESDYVTGTGTDIVRSDDEIADVHRLVMVRPNDTLLIVESIGLPAADTGAPVSHEQLDELAGRLDDRRCDLDGADE